MMVSPITGTSGYNDTKAVTSQTTRVYTAPSDLAFFIGGTTRNYRARGTGQGVYNSGEEWNPGDYKFFVNTNASSKLCVKYTYIETTCISGYKLNERGQGLAGWTIFIDKGDIPNGQLDAGMPRDTGRSAACYPAAIPSARF
jgi:hypothetical protein